MSENWVSPFDLVTALTRRYPQPKLAACIRIAENELLSRAAEGELPAKADYLFWGRDGISGHWRGKQTVPARFWNYFRMSRRRETTTNWMLGHFLFFIEREKEMHLLRGEARPYGPDEVCLWRGEALGVTFDASAWPELGLTAAPEKPAPAPSANGRPPANWWPDFAEELAFIIHEHGPPETQSALIERVQAALVERGKPEPSRTQIQPVIRALYKRLGLAGK